MNFLPIALLFLIAILIVLVFMLNGLFGIFRTHVPYIPTPPWAINWLKQNLAIPAESVVFDLGCGDGRVLAELAKRHPDSQFIGLELQWWPYIVAKWRAKSLPNLTIKRSDFWSQPVASATFVFVYLFPPIFARMKSKLESELRPGTPIVSYGFSFPDWHTEQKISDPSGRVKSRLLFYRR